MSGVIPMARTPLELALRIRRSTEAFLASSLREEASEALREFRRLAAERTDRPNVEDMTYALAAFLDEAALSSPLRDTWRRHPIQVELFGECRAGEEFFRRLDEVRGDPSRTDALEVFYLCLLLGFRGRYAVRGKELTLVDLQRSIRLELERAHRVGPSALSPCPGPFETGRPPRRVPALRYLMGGLIAVVVLYISLQLHLGVLVSTLVPTG